MHCWSNFWQKHSASWDLTQPSRQTWLLWSPARTQRKTARAYETCCSTISMPQQVIMCACSAGLFGRANRASSSTKGVHTIVPVYEGFALQHIHYRRQVLGYK